MIRQLTERHTITLPKKVLDHTGIKEGDFLEIRDDGRQIILRPKVMEDTFSDHQWEKLEKLSKQPGKVYKTAKAAKEHLRRL
jgi:AbrB family looped-hinge helix DNA binding protein